MVNAFESFFFLDGRKSFSFVVSKVVATWATENTEMSTFVLDIFLE